MRLTNYFLQQVKSKLFDEKAFPRHEGEVVGITVGELRKLINAVEFANKEPYNASKHSRDIHEAIAFNEQG